MNKELSQKELSEILEDWYEIAHERPTEVACNNPSKCKQAYKQLKKLLQPVKKAKKQAPVIRFPLVNQPQIYIGSGIKT